MDLSEMDSFNRNGGRQERPPSLPPAIIELSIILAIACALLFFVIPAQTSAADEYGLSPAFMPSVCVVAIAAVAVLQFLTGSSGKGDDDEVPPAIKYAVALALAVIVGVVVVTFAGIVVGGAVTSLLVLLALRQRRIRLLVLLPVCVAAVLAAVQATGM